jgi:hypothetical protein
MDRRFCWANLFASKLAIHVPHVDDAGLWCRGLTCLPVTEEIAGSNPVRPAKHNQFSKYHFYGIFCFMDAIPRIIPVRIKTEQISQELINPGSGGRYFPSGVGPRVVYLDERYEHSPQESDDVQAERSRQADMWSMFRDSGGVQFLDRQVEGDFPNRNEVWLRTQEEMGHSGSAKFYERVFSKLFNETMDVVIIATGVTTFTGDNYHEIGYLR